MIVDCHTHVRSLSDAEVSEHLAAVEAVDACIVHAGFDGPRDQVNRKLCEYVDKHNDRMVGFAVVDPTRDRIDEKAVTSLTEKLGFRGVVLYCSMCGFHPAHSLAMRFYEAVQEFCTLRLCSKCLGHSYGHKVIRSPIEVLEVEQVPIVVGHSNKVL